MLREPLFHFAVAGALLFSVHAAFASATAAPDEGDRRIQISDQWVETQAQARAMSLGLAPQQVDRDLLRREAQREEALVREARSLGLDAGDLIIRRRLAQKMELVLRAGLQVPEPSDEELQAYLDAEPDRFRRPGQLRFRHIFFSRDLRTDPEADAAVAAERIGTDGDSTGVGDAFMLGSEIATEPASLIERFGAEFASALDAVPLQAWSSPIESQFGFHLVLLETRDVEVRATLDEVRDRLVAEVRRRAEDQALEDAIEGVVATYPLAPASTRTDR
ncbi:MAG: peptidylprolyl isomerase [Myxococcota bacterium]